MMKRILYLGIDPSHYVTEGLLVHWPIINIVSTPFSDLAVQTTLQQMEQFTHLIFTSKSAAVILNDYLNRMAFDKRLLKDKCILAVGKVTARQLELCGMTATIVSKRETAEGIIEELKDLSMANAHLFWPHSFLARPVIKEYLISRNIKHTTLALYSPQKRTHGPYPELDNFDEIVFTSPSTVTAFLDIFTIFPPHAKLIAIGPITEACLAHFAERDLSNNSIKT